jgi:hypothetical protein
VHVAVLEASQGGKSEQLPVIRNAKTWGFSRGAGRCGGWGVCACVHACT